MNTKVIFHKKSRFKFKEKRRLLFKNQRLKTNNGNIHQNIHLKPILHHYHVDDELRFYEHYYINH